MSVRISLSNYHPSLASDRLRNNIQTKETMSDTLSSSRGHHEHKDPVGSLFTISEGGRLELLLQHTSVSSGAS